jgi:hypothetical protein
VLERLGNVTVNKGKLKKQAVLEKGQKQQLNKKFRENLNQLEQMALKYPAIKLMQVNPCTAPVLQNENPTKKEKKAH